MALYTILEQGVDDDGAWARYINALGEETRMEVMQGLDIEEEIRLHEEDRKRLREEWASLSPEERERTTRILNRAFDRWGNAF